MTTTAKGRSAAIDFYTPLAAFGRGWRSGFYSRDEVSDDRWTAENPYEPGTELAWRWDTGKRMGQEARLRFPEEMEKANRAEKARRQARRERKEQRKQASEERKICRQEAWAEED